MTTTINPNHWGFCDHCGYAYKLGADSHNPETGNHYECERPRPAVIHSDKWEYLELPLDCNKCGKSNKYCGCEDE